MKVLEVGQQFAGRYRILRELASGGMGAVYVALQEATELQVALKVLWPHVLETKDAAGRFQLEAKVAARIQSDNIVKVFDAGYDQASQMPFLVMELLQGQNLDDWVQQRGPLSWDLTVQWLAQVASALDKAHSYRDGDGESVSIVHRDLKPENLFLTTRDNGEHLIKVLDFGIAKILSQSTSVTRDALGTPAYMACEQAAGEAVSPQTDIWALGLIAYFLLTGSSYWRAATGEGDIRALFAEILSLPMSPASKRAAELGVHLPERFDGWFARCVNRDPRQRFASAGEAIDALSYCLLGQGLLAQGAESRASGLPIESSPTMVSSGTPPHSVVGSGAMRSGPISDDTMTPSSRTHRSRRGTRLPLIAAGVAVTVIGLGVVAVAWPTDEGAEEAELEAPLSSSQAAAQAPAQPADSALAPLVNVPESVQLTTAEPAASAAPTAEAAPPKAAPKIRRKPRPPKPRAELPPTPAPKPQPKVEATPPPSKAPERDPLAGPRR